MNIVQNIYVQNEFSEITEYYKKFDVSENKDGKVLASAYNRRESGFDATAHAEILAIRKACKKLKDFRLIGSEMYVTLEPCVMCVGAILNSRIENVYFGALHQFIKEL